MSHKLDNFHINKPEDASGFIQVEKQDELRFQEARDGDHLMCSFQCDLCLFYRMKGRLPIEHDMKDELLLVCLRRANLDAMWSREPSTVASNRREMEKMLKISAELGIDPSFAALGPFPLEDIQGVNVAIHMLRRSLDPGRYASYSQFETIRKFRATFSNAYMASVSGAIGVSSLGRNTPKTFFTQCPTNSIWFEKFAQGCLKRMGQVIRQDLGISIEVELALLEHIKREIREAEGWHKNKLIMAGAYASVCFCGSFRGHEVFLTDLSGLIKYQKETEQSGRDEYIVLPLLGRFKGETGERYHLTPLAAVTKSEIQNGPWIKLLLRMHAKLGNVRGPAFVDQYGQRMTSKQMQPLILNMLLQVQALKPHIISPDVDVLEEYGISRSFRRGATTHARNQGVRKSDITAANRWRDKENAQGRNISQPMIDHYSEVRQMLPTLLRFSKAL